jgi:hypothetical protein
MPSDEPIAPEPARKCTVLEYVENNPVAAVVQSLAIGLAVGMVIRLIERSHEKEPEIDVKRKPTLEEAKFHLGSLLLPFLWPAWHKAQEGYGKSAESVRETVEKLKKSDLSHEGRKHLKKAEEWAEREAEYLAELGKAKAKHLEQWAEREAEHMAELGKTKAKHVEKWVEEEILPAAECGWKKLRKFFG